MDDYFSTYKDCFDNSGKKVDVPPTMQRIETAG
jgi:hypothetical protein